MSVRCSTAAVGSVSSPASIWLRPKGMLSTRFADGVRMFASPTTPGGRACMPRPGSSGATADSQPRTSVRPTSRSRRSSTGSSGTCAFHASTFPRCSRSSKAFDGYWEDPEFEPYDPARDRERFECARKVERPQAPFELLALDVNPYPHQQEILDRLTAERDLHCRWKNLVVAATGTGKTVIAALDYRRVRRMWGEARLLYVAHRREILHQSRSTFRAVLRDGSFGELWSEGERPVGGKHVFASIQTFARVDLDALSPDVFEVVIVDEVHHAEARTYERLLAHLRPRLLLGLTATPERADGEDIRRWFDGRVAAELRLWTALERGLLCPFQYFGLHDDVDL